MILDTREWNLNSLFSDFMWYTIYLPELFPCSAAVLFATTEVLSYKFYWTLPTQFTYQYRRCLVKVKQFSFYFLFTINLKYLFEIDKTRPLVIDWNFVYILPIFFFSTCHIFFFIFISTTDKHTFLCLRSRLPDPEVIVVNVNTNYLHSSVFFFLSFSLSCTLMQIFFSQRYNLFFLLNT